MMRRLPLVLVAALAWGCDTSDLSDAERIVGQWEPASIDLRVAADFGVPLATLSGDNGRLVIESRGFFQMELTLGGKIIIPNTDVTVNLPADLDLTGTYMLDEDADTITVTRGTQSTTLRYDLTSFFGEAESLQFIADTPEELVALLGVELEEAQAFFSVASGAALRFQRPAR